MEYNKKVVDGFIAEITARYNAATSGEWDYDDDEVSAYTKDDYGMERRAPVIFINNLDDDPDNHFIDMTKEDEEFISNVKSDMAYLFSVISELQEREQKIKTFLNDMLGS